MVHLLTYWTLTVWICTCELHTQCIFARLSIQISEKALCHIELCFPNINHSFFFVHSFPDLLAVRLSYQFYEGCDGRGLAIIESTLVSAVKVCDYNTTPCLVDQSFCAESKTVWPFILLTKCLCSNKVAKDTMGQCAPFFRVSYDRNIGTAWQPPPENTNFGLWV